MPLRRIVRGVMGVLLLAGLAGPAPAAPEEPVTPQLTPKLDRLLRQEMAAIDEAMRTIFQALVRGDHGTVADRARAIHDSFILKRELTAADRKALKRAVPPAFLKLDRAFHKDAARLAEAARAGDSERQLAVFQAMTEACVDCHRRFVSDRFPGLVD